MKKWYILQVYSGNEEKLKNEIERSVGEKGLLDFFEEIIVPSSDVVDENNAEGSRAKGSFFHVLSGYILVKMEYNVDLVHLILNIDKVVKFLGGSKPSPLTDEEFLAMTSVEDSSSDSSNSNVSYNFEEGMEVDVKEGPFAGFIGKVKSIDEDKKRLVLMISIFGRSTPIEVSFDHIKV